MTENQQPPQRPGAWPTDPVDLDAINEQQAERAYGEQYMALQADRALHALVLDNIRIHLAAQPSPATIRTAATRWKNAIAQLADDLINTRRNEP